ncbi:ABC transporter ATPase [Clostridium perfringens]|uniref:ABC transporter ATPase n=1 Tax=Clostridium perfringens TaxID=1502 RepID=UPI003753F19A
MGELNTIQKREKLNTVYVVYEEDIVTGANHEYQIWSNYYDNEEKSELLAKINFQNGARQEKGSTRGIIDTDLLEIVKHRLEGFQSGKFYSRENQIALMHIEEALLWLNKRVEDRIERNVLGTNKK